MATTYEKVTDVAVTELCEKMLSVYHGDLKGAGVTVDLVWHHRTDSEGNDVPMKAGGYSAAAKIRVTSLKDRAKGNADAEIVIDQPTWNDLHENQRAALIDHELEHLALVVSDGGEPKTDNLGRPRLKLAPHDWRLEGFVSVVGRHQDAALECENLVRFVNSESGQMVMQWGQKG
jgi:hypothetical protein